MAKNFVKEGNYLTLTAPTGGVVSGSMYLIGAILVVAVVSAAVGDEFEGAVCGVWELPKTSANTPAQGALAYWNDTAKEVTTTATGNKLIGVFIKAYGAGTTAAQVRLNGSASQLMSLISDITKDASRAANTVLGELCVYTNYRGEDFSATIVINRNKEVQNEFGILAGFRFEAAILIEEVPELRIHDTFIDESGQKWRINLVPKKTTSKYYADIIGVD